MTPVSGKLVPLYNKGFLEHVRSKLSRSTRDSTDYSTHSFRRGGATWALAQGLPGESIKILGDWKSSAYLSYLSLDLQSKTDTIYNFSSNLPYSY